MIQASELAFSGAQLELNDSASFGDRDVLSFNGFLEVDDGDDGPVCLTLQLLDLNPAGSGAEQVDHSQSRLDVTFVPDSHVSVSTP